MSPTFCESKPAPTISDYFADQAVQDLIALRVEMGADKADVITGMATEMGANDQEIEAELVRQHAL